MSLHPEQIELTDEEVERINSEAKVFALGYIHPLKNNFETIYDLKRENLKLQLIISKFKV